MGDSGVVIRTSNRQMVRQIKIDDATLDRVAEALGIPAAERRQFISNIESVQIYRGARPSPGAPPSPGTPPSPPAGGRRRRT
jgi:hypothetical protein